MAIEDFRAVDTDCPIEADLCLVGSGPAGFAIAEELRRQWLARPDGSGERRPRARAGHDRTE